jgi:hypothetical protein
MGDIVSAGPPRDYVVVGWFTEDATYRPIAERFAASLRDRGEPFHLFAKSKPAGKTWMELILMKPAVVLEAMAVYPGKTIVLMDVDCIVSGDIAPAMAFDGDVAIAAFSGTLPRRPTDWRIWLGLSSRVVVFKPTAVARAFAGRREETAGRIGGHEERCMAMAFLSSPDVRFAYLDVRYSGREVGETADAVIAHDSTHGKEIRRSRGPVKRLLRAIERPFRSGRTRMRKQLEGPGIVALAATVHARGSP